MFDSFALLPWEWTAWICAGLFIGLTKAGFSGLNAVIIPVIAVIFGPRLSTALILIPLCFADVLAAAYYRKNAEWKYILRLMPWTLLGFTAAIFVVETVSSQVFRYLMGGSIFAGLIVMFWNEFLGKDKSPPVNLWFAALFGIAGGFATVVGNVAGPIMAVFLLSMGLPKESFAGTTAWFFLIVNYAKLPIHIFLWNTINPETLLFSLSLVPAVLSGVVLGVFFIKKISEPLYKKLIMALTLVSTVLLFIPVTSNE